VSSAGRAAFVLPVFLGQEVHVNPPNCDLPTCLEGFRLVYRVAPYDVPAGVVVVRLDCPRPRARLRFKSFLWWRANSPIEGQIREPRLGHVWMPVLLVRTESVQRLVTEYADDGAKDVGLFVVEIDEFRGPPLCPIDGLSYVDEFEPTRELDRWRLSHR